MAPLVGSLRRMSHRFTFWRFERALRKYRSPGIGERRLLILYNRCSSIVDSTGCAYGHEASMEKAKEHLLRCLPKKIDETKHRNLHYHYLSILVSGVVTPLCFYKGMQWGLGIEDAVWASLILNGVSFGAFLAFLPFVYSSIKLWELSFEKQALRFWKRERRKLREEITNELK